MIPDKPGWWWWRASLLGDSPNVPVYLMDAGDLAPERGVLGWLVCYLVEHPHLKDRPLIPHPGSRTVRTMGGVWLGPCEPAKPPATIYPMSAHDRHLLIEGLWEGKPPKPKEKP